MVPFLSNGVDERGDGEYRLLEACTLSHSGDGRRRHEGTPKCVGLGKHLAGLAIEAGAGEALATAIRAANTAAEALDLAEADGIPLGDAVATAARDHALTVLRGSPVAVDVICIDRGGAIVGNSA